MGYFDALTGSYFKAAPDGRKFFFPWGTFARGYAIPSEQHYERMRRQLKIYTIVSLVAVIGSSLMQGFLVSLAVAGALILFYLIWSRSLLRGLTPSQERLTMTESMTNQARAHGTAGIWMLEIISLAFVAAGAVILIADPTQWFVGLSCIVFFGLCAVIFARMLVLRRRTGPSRA